ncbi:MAG TPA: hypothetical protein VFO78_05235 [Candidatus Limnocylindrales bacterium]|nr:hypothetical protein [Candidatus Limnocylindrales bacterium]
MTEPSAGFGGTAPAAVRRPSKFLADLTRAMQAAAEEARALTLAQFQADAKTYVEKIHDRSATGAANLRRAADDDVAAVREWSKAEIARIREETESRISARKARLEGEIEEHTALIEREVEGVQARVAAFEQEMADFFARLLVEDDPTRFATMAERLPEPPPFEEMSTESTLEALAARTHAATVEVAEPVDADPYADAGEGHADADAGDEILDAAASADVTEEAADTAEFSTGSDEPTGHAHDDPEVELDRDAAFAAIQAAAEAAASAEVAEDAAARAEAVAEAIEIVGPHDEADAPVEGEADVATEETAEGEATTDDAPDFDAAEAEAAASADATDPVEEIPVIGDDALAARLADLLPGKHEENSTGQETQTTQVVVVGLVSVASIASFKRHLGRLAGVSSVGVSSGPDGEFLFAVHHAPDVVLRDVIPSMPSFQARVTASGEGTLNVTAHDPESEN